MVPVPLIIKRGRPLNKGSCAKCANCRKKNRSVFLTCTYCTLQFCTRCLLPETHKCTQLQDAHKKAADRNACNVLSSACKKDKVAQID